MPHTVSAVARMAGITVRTLHHYDEIGVLSPSARSSAGYRLYEDDDLDRLQEVLFYRELGLGLEQIRRAMQAPDFDRLGTLHAQRALLEGELHRLQRLVGAVERAINAEEIGIMLSDDERFEVFGDFDPAEHEAEVQERWGDTVAYAESRRRTSHYTKDDWVAIKEEASSISRRLADAMHRGLQSDGEEAMALADEHRRHVDRWFYPCSKPMHRMLADMWVADPRFQENLDSIAAGLAHYMSAAAVANAESG